MRESGVMFVNRFESNEQPAFARGFDAETARRQFHTSLVLGAAMAAAAFVLGFALPLDTPHAPAPAAMLGDADDIAGRIPIGEP